MFILVEAYVNLLWSLSDSAMISCGVTSIPVGKYKTVPCVKKSPL